MERDKDGMDKDEERGKREIPVAPPRIISATRGKDHQASQPVIKRNFSLPLLFPFFLSLPFLFSFSFSFFVHHQRVRRFLFRRVYVENSCNIKYACTRLQKRFQGNLKHGRGRSWSNEWTDRYIYIYMYIRVKHRGGEYICISVEIKAGTERKIVAFRRESNVYHFFFLLGSCRQMSLSWCFLKLRNMEGSFHRSTW